MECLIDQLLNLQKENKVTLSPTIREELVGEAGRNRGKYGTQIVVKKLKQAAQELRQNENIIIRRGDKSSVYVIMDKEDYFNKMDNILNNTSKFQKLMKRS